jgi:hypothetical protein
MAPTMRAGEPAWMTKLHETFAAALAMVVTGAFDKAPSCLANIHDATARVTDAPTRSASR